MHDIAQHATAVHSAIFILGCVAFGVTAELVRFRSLLHKRLALVSIVIVAGAALWVTTPATPAPSDLNGTYRSLGGEALTLKDGVLITPQQRVPFKVQLLKFGLIGNLSVPVEVRDGRVVAAANASTSALTFSDDLKVLTICGRGHCGDGNEYQFRRQ